MNKLVVAIIGQDCKEWLNLAIKSVETYADAIVFIDGNPDNPSYINTDKVTVISRVFEHNHKGAIGRARNAYLNYVKEHYNGWWCLVLDADECVDNISLLKKDLDNFDADIYSIHMRHWINDFMKEDATIKKHHVLHRLFKIQDCLYYPETEHALLSSNEKVTHKQYDGVCIWHLGYIKHLFEIRKKWKNHLSKSNIHNETYLRSWYLQHILGMYPTSPTDPSDFPKTILDYFEIADIKDEIYFKRRMQIEEKHWYDAATWKDYFNPTNALFLGCGVGLRMAVASKFGIQPYGYEMSKWAVYNTPFERLKPRMFIQDISKMDPPITFDLVVAYDVFEHMKDEKQLDETLSRTYKACRKHLLCSIPFIGDPNLELDKTHFIKQTREWWEKKITEHGFKIIETPKNFAYPQQLIVCEKLDHKPPKTKTPTNVIIICAGEGTRWNGNLNVEKHFIEIEGETILDRTIKLVKKYQTGETNIYIVANDDKYKREGTILYKPKLNPKNRDADKFLSSKELWNKDGRTVVLYGDVWFSEYAMRTIMEYKNNDWILFARAVNSYYTGKDYGECFAQSFYPHNLEEHEAGLKEIIKLYDSEVITRCGGWEHYKAMIGFAKEQKLIIYGRFFSIDDFTDDFDSKEDYDEWIKRRSK